MLLGRGSVDCLRGRCVGLYTKGEYRQLRTRVCEPCYRLISKCSTLWHFLIWNMWMHTKTIERKTLIRTKKPYKILNLVKVVCMTRYSVQELRIWLLHAGFANRIDNVMYISFLILKQARENRCFWIHLNKRVYLSNYLSIWKLPLSSDSDYTPVFGIGVEI